MPTAALSFGELLDAIATLPDDEQAELAAIVQRRLREQGRQRVVREVRAARRQFARGAATPATASALLRECRP